MQCERFEIPRSASYMGTVKLGRKLEVYIKITEMLLVMYSYQ